MEFEKIRRKSLEQYHSERLKSFTLSNYYSDNLSKIDYDSFNTFDERKRVDKFGNIISKKNKKNYKISFIDEIHKDKPLAAIYKVQSIKKYHITEEKKSIFLYKLKYIGIFAAQKCIIF
jgi:hypothetical protein